MINPNMDKRNKTNRTRTIIMTIETVLNVFFSFLILLV